MPCRSCSSTRRISRKREVRLSTDPIIPRSVSLRKSSRFVSLCIRADAPVYSSLSLILEEALRWTQIALLVLFGLPVMLSLA